jgi:hypothetical protein
MRWKSQPNFAVALILSFIYIVMTLLDIIGPMHINAQGGTNPPGAFAAQSIIFLMMSLVITWETYALLRDKPKAAFFTLIILGIIFILIDLFFWGWLGS